MVQFYCVLGHICKHFCVYLMGLLRFLDLSCRRSACVTYIYKPIDANATHASHATVRPSTMNLIDDLYLECLSNLCISEFVGFRSK